MSTFGGLTDSTLLYLFGFTNHQEQETYLTASITAADTTLSMADLTSVSRGVIEIGDELIRVDDVNQSGLVATVPPYGRGYRGTTAAVHSTGDRVVSAPMVPRTMVKEALNQATQSVFPMVSAVGSTTFTYSAGTSTYSLPSGTKSVLEISWQDIGSSAEWIPVRRWRMDSVANTTAFATGATVSVYDAIVPGRTVKVTYLSQPTAFTAETDEFTASGLPSTCEDVVRLGAAMRLVPFLDVPHLSGFSAEADFAANMRPVGGAQQLSKYLMQQYAIRVQEEADRQQELYPVRAHYTR